MKWSKVHVGIHRQGVMSDEEIAAAEDAGVTPGINPRLHAPEIVNPADEPETNLHGDIDGSPYSRNPGEISVAEAAERAAAGGASGADKQSTREREIESRKSGVPTETLARAEEAEDAKPSKAKK